MTRTKKHDEHDELYERCLVAGFGLLYVLVFVLVLAPLHRAMLMKLGLSRNIAAPLFGFEWQKRWDEWWYSGFSNEWFFVICLVSMDNNSYIFHNSYNPMVKALRSIIKVSKTKMSWYWRIVRCHWNYIVSHW